MRTRFALVALLLLGAAFFTALHEGGVISTRRLYSVLGSLLGLVPGSLHLRRSKRQAPPRNLWRWLSAMAVVAVGSLHVLPWLPFIEWYNFLPVQSRDWLQVVDSVACFGSTCIASVCVSLRHPPSTYVRHAVWAICGIWMIVVSLTAVSMVPSDYQTILQHLAWHLEGTVFKWTAWLMVGRIVALDRRSSLGMAHPNRLVNIATICFHARVVTETFFDSTPVSFLLQLVFAVAFVIIWMAICFPTMACVAKSLRVVQKEARKVTGAPQAEAQWAKKVLKFELAASMCLTFTCTTLWWIPHQVLLWGAGQQTADSVLLVPMIVAHRLNMLVKAASAATLSGLLWHFQAPQTAPTSNLQIQIHGPQQGDAQVWSQKVDELAHRAISLESLLRFWGELPKVMSSFDPARSTTNDVVHMAIIPLSRSEGGTGGHSLASVWSGGQRLRAKCMVTHNWSNLFLHLVAGILADALGESYYDAVAAKLLSPAGVEELAAMLQQAPKTAYWVCAFSINQHACICHGFSQPSSRDLGGTAPQRWPGKDSANGVPYPVCDCQEPKIFNDQPALCEMNKFNAMMRHLASLEKHFSHLVIADSHFKVFTRAWCIAEIVESEVSQVPKRIKIHSQSSLDNHYQSLSCIDVRDCEASRPEDRDMILSGISDLDALNAELQWAIFGTRGLPHRKLLSKWVDGPGRAALVARILRRIEGQAVLSAV